MLGLPRWPTAQTVPGPTAAASQTVPVLGVVSLAQLAPFQRRHCCIWPKGGASG
jgi:hypothetical protein